MGRPTNNPKNEELKVRISQEEKDKLEYCMKNTNKNKSEIVREGIDKVYKELKKQSIPPNRQTVWNTQTIRILVLTNILYHK